MAVRDFSIQNAVPFQVSLPGENFQHHHHCCLHVLKEKVEEVGECAWEGWRSSAWHFQRGWEKNKERWRGKALLRRLESFTPVTEVRAISWQLLLAARPRSNIIREILLGILCKLPISPGSWFCSGTRESWAFRQLHSMPCVHSFAKWPVHQQGLQQTCF